MGSGAPATRPHAGRDALELNTKGVNHKLHKHLCGRELGLDCPTAPNTTLTSPLIVNVSLSTVYRLLGSAENLLQHGAYESTFRAFQKSVFQIIILKTAL